MSENFEHPVIEQVYQAILEIEQTEKLLSETKQTYQAIIDFHQSGQQLLEVLNECRSNNRELVEQLLLYVFDSVHLIEGQMIMDDPLRCWINKHLDKLTHQERAVQLKSLREMPYPEYLQTAHWKLTREFKIHKANDRCQICNAFGVQLNVHHRTYERRGRELDTDLIVLCQECHETFHTNGKLAKQD